MPENCCPGGSCVIDPYGKYVAAPVWNREEMIIADLNLDDIVASRLDMDFIGYYSRPDVFELIVHE